MATAAPAMTGDHLIICAYSLYSPAELPEVAA